MNEEMKVQQHEIQATYDYTDNRPTKKKKKITMKCDTKIMHKCPPLPRQTKSDI